MVDGGPRNDRQVRPEDKCNWCNEPVGMKGAQKSVPGFPYCPPDQKKETRKK